MIFYVIGAILITVLILVSIVYFMSSRRSHVNSPERTEEQLRRFIRDNVSAYGVNNHGSSMDDVNKIQNIKPDKMGL